MAEDFVNALADLKEEKVLEMVQSRLDVGDDPQSILNDSSRAMEIVGQRFSDKDYHIPDLVYSGEILKIITGMIKPKMAKKAAEWKHLGKVIMGTVAGDIHDIGKDIVTFMLEVNGFEVYDLGVSVSAIKFVDKIKETNTRVVGLSGFLTAAFDEMKNTVEAIEAAGLRDKVKIMIGGGGGAMDERLRDYTGADDYGMDAMDAVNLAKKWLGGE
jgi:methanogenic corrinoid protein MtbC1